MMKVTELVNVTGYLRVSGRGQVEGDGLHRQKEAIEEFCRVYLPNAHIDFAREEGVSGTIEADKRPMFAAMLASWDDGSAEKPYAIIVENLDRLSRELMIQECAIADLRKRGIKVFACNWGLVDVSDDVDDPSRTMIRQVFGAIAQYAKSVTNLRCAVARRRIREATGKCEGRKFFGEINDHDRSIVVKVLSLFDTGLKSRLIAKILDGEGYVTSSRRHITDRLVRRIIARHRKVDPNPTMP